MRGGIEAGPVELPRRVLRKVSLRLLTVLFIAYVLSYLDRTNIAVAKIDMAPALGLSEAAYGLGAGIFFVGYVLCEVPSNLVLHRVGARLWITRIMVTWGILAALLSVVNSEWSLYLVRFLLGAAEAGLVPGAIFYLTRWYPARYRARVLGYFYLAIPLSTVLGAPLTGYLMTLTPWGIAGWRFMFAVEGLAAALFAIVVYTVLVDRPADARWLDDEEKAWLTHELEEDRRRHDADPAALVSMRAVLRDRKVLSMSFAYFLMVLPLYALSFFLPSIVEEMGGERAAFSTFEVGLLTAVPFLAAAVGLVAISLHSDRRNERTLHFTVAATAGAAGLVVAGVALEAPIVALVGFCAGAVGCISTLPTFWAVLTPLLRGRAAAGGIALVNSVGSASGFFAPYLIGLVRDSADEPAASTVSLVGVGLCLLAAALIVFAVGRASLLVTNTN